MNGFQKKTQKTPQKEIQIALKLKKEYEDERKQHHHTGTV
jgi:phage-related protein